MRFCDIIEAKKRGEELSRSQLEYAIDKYLASEIPDYQMSAFLMAVYFKGMTDKETADLTDIMAKSGDMVDLEFLGVKTVDKHSTGGVGDKTTLIISPIVAECGGIVAKMSGRGLGHTGGTIDKLESIPGYDPQLSEEKFIECVRKTGVSVIAAQGQLAPADKKLYALRDVTSTVDSIPLIASSVMSKKLAAGCKSIVLDVKFGSGAFMKTPELATVLAEKMVAIGEACGRKVRAVISNMDVPLGKYVGNLLEVKEALQVLEYDFDSELAKVCLSLSGHMLSLSLGVDYESAYQMAKEALTSGKALKRFEIWIKGQGADVNALYDKIKAHGKNTYSLDVVVHEQGYIYSMNTEKIGLCSLALGGGRLTKESEIDYLAGIMIEKTAGDCVNNGEVIATLYSTDKERLEGAMKIYLSAIEIKKEKPMLYPHIYKVI